MNNLKHEVKKYLLDNVKLRSIGFNTPRIYTKTDKPVTPRVNYFTRWIAKKEKGVLQRASSYLEQEKKLILGEP